MNLGQLCSNKITVRATLRIGIGEAYSGYGPEVEYDVKHDYSPDENGYVENYKLISVLGPSLTSCGVGSGDDCVSVTAVNLSSTLTVLASRRPSEQNT